MAGTRAGWERELGRWLKPFLERWVTRRGNGCVRFMWLG